MAELVGGAVLSALFQSLFDRIDSREVIDFFHGKKQLVGLLEKLKRILLAVGAVLDDAELKQLGSPRVKDWLLGLRDAVEDAENLLEGISTDAMHVKAEAESGGCSSSATCLRFRGFISSVFHSSDRATKAKVKEILERLEGFAEQKYVLQLNEGRLERPWKRLESSSVMESSEVFGRNDDKNAVMKLVVSNDDNGKPLVVIPIVGMGGVGKTTLAQAVFNDEGVMKAFNVKAWVCVSEEFDVCKVTRMVLESATSKAYSGVADLNTLQVNLKEKLNGTKFLIVLDDVWNDSDADWNVLGRPFQGGAEGSKIIVTTRSDKVASIMGTASTTHHLKQLSNQDCWKLFAKHASGNGNFVDYPELEGLSEEIVKKCQGLPLAAKTLGGLLRSTRDVSDWERVLRNEIWEFTENESNILPALRVSYYYLPPHLKRCFAYCSMLPKDYEFNKDTLVLLWMAENLLVDPNRNTRMEDLGYEYFKDLASRSFFQMSNSTSSCFTMHDLIVDLARSVSGNYFQLGSDNSDASVKKVRHLAYRLHQNHSHQMFHPVFEASRLRSFLSLNDNCYSSEANLAFHLVLKLRFLRSLSLAGYQSLTHLPDSIGELRHLRYLDISKTSISCLPDSITMLYNLQTLLLVNCTKLKTLPRGMHRLINLRHLVTWTSGLEKSPKMSKWKKLQVLSDFYVGKDDDESRVRELGQLPNLRGSLCINNLRNVVNANDALEAKLMDKKYLQGLSLSWGIDYADDTSHERLVLEYLVPSTTLKYLSINGYGGTRYPNWVGNRSYCQMVSISLEGFRQCTVSLPPLGQLPALKTLHISHFNEIVTVGPEFYGSSASSALKPFAALEELTFYYMSSWEEWLLNQVEDVSAPFPKLMHLQLQMCDEFIGSLPRSLPSLLKLEIIDCPQIRCSLPNMPLLNEVTLDDCNGLLPQALPPLPPTVEKLTIKSCGTNLVSLSETLMEMDDRLHYLELEDCSSLTTLGSLPTALRKLSIFRCEKLELSFPLSHDSLENISIIGACDSALSFPLNSFPNLKSLFLSFFKNLESFSLVDGVSQVMPSLTNLYIGSCPNLLSLPGGGFSAPNLTSLRIVDCDKLRCERKRIHTIFPSLKELRIVNCPGIDEITSPME